MSKRHHQKVKVVVSKGIKQGTVPTDILDATSANGKDPINALKRAGFDNIEQTPPMMTRIPWTYLRARCLI